jgi:hypothetical protein
VKLLLSRDLRHCFERYQGEQRQARRMFWLLHAGIGSLSAGSTFAIARPRPGVVRYGFDGWRAIAEATNTGFGFFAASLDTTRLSTDQSVDFTTIWSDERWIGEDYRALAVSPPS